MTFQVVIGAQPLKGISIHLIPFISKNLLIPLPAFTKCLACLARYGDDVTIQADINSLTLSSTNSSKSAYCQVKLGASYFDKYYARASRPPGSTYSTPPSQPDKILGQLVVKVCGASLWSIYKLRLMSVIQSLLSILRHKTVEKIIERCQLSISDPGHEDSNDEDSDEEKDSLELRLIVRLYCKHGMFFVFCFAFC